MGEGPLLGKALSFLQLGGAPGGRHSLLQARTSALEVDILPDTGKLSSRRLDVLVGRPGRGTPRSGLRCNTGCQHCACMTFLCRCGSWTVPGQGSLSHIGLVRWPSVPCAARQQRVWMLVSFLIKDDGIQLLSSNCDCTPVQLPHIGLHMPRDLSCMLNALESRLRGCSLLHTLATQLINVNGASCWNQM